MRKLRIRLIQIFFPPVRLAVQKAQRAQKCNDKQVRLGPIIMNDKIKYFDLLRPPMLLCRQPFSLILYNCFIACKIKTQYLQNIFSADLLFC